MNVKAWACGVTLAMGHAASAEAATVVPTVYEAGHFYVTPTLAKGGTLKLILDTGGPGPTWGLFPITAARLGLASATCDGHDFFLQPPEFEPGKGLPASARSCGKVFKASATTVTDTSVEGVVGSFYLFDHAWTFDYPKQQLIVEDASWHPTRGARDAQVAFMLNARGDVGSPLPTITMKVDGKPFDMLLDTGATAHPSPAGLKTMGTRVAGGGFAAGSYIVTSVMDAWHAAHPDWPMVDGGDDLSGAAKATRTIRVPAVEIAGQVVGPVWFIERRDAAFSDKGIGQYMVGDVKGAVGGNVYAHFRMTIDYPHKKAWFTCIQECMRAP
jgi:predicted aspartyl protease